MSNNRFLIDYSNPDAGIGHSLGFINQALKICLRNNLSFCYSEEQLKKSSFKSWRWKLAQLYRLISFRRAYETHNIGNDLNIMFDFKNVFLTRSQIERRVKAGELELIQLPYFETKIPSNMQIDDEAYSMVDDFIKNNPQENVVFAISPHEYGDSEYFLTKNILTKAYSLARETYPIPLDYADDILNIAVHIRRGDLLPGRQFSDLSSRMLPDSWYLFIIREIVKICAAPMKIYIFSEGQNGKYYSEVGSAYSWKEALHEYKCDVIEMIDVDFMKTFHHLVNADILIGSKSGMTHISGIIGNQIKIVPKMWHSYKGATKTLEIHESPLAELDKLEGFLKQHLQ